MDDRRYEELARRLADYPGRWIPWPVGFATRAEADRLFEPLRDAARCMVDYAGILDDPREPFAPACDMPVICTTTVTEKTVVSDVRPLVGLPDDAYDDIVAGEMDYVGVRSGTDGPVYVGQLPGSVEQAYDEYLDMMTDIMSGSWRAVPQDALEAAQWLAYRLSELTQRHLVLERSRTWKLAE